MYILLRICLFQVGYTWVSMDHGYDFVAQLRILYLRVSSPQRFRIAYLFSLFLGEGKKKYFFNPHWTYQLPKKVGQKII